MSDQSPEATQPSSPSLAVRLLHTTGEVLVSFALAGGVFCGLSRWMCLADHRCEDFRGIFYLLVSAVVATIVWVWFLGLVKAFRRRQQARRALDITATLLTAASWAAYFVL